MFANFVRTSRWALAIVFGAIPSLLFACPFCATAGQTLLGETNQAHLIIFGTLTNAQRDPNEFGKGTTEMEIEVVVKDHEFLKGRKKITLPRYVPQDVKNPTKHLIFCEVYKGELDPYRGEAVAADSKIALYLKSALELKDKDVVARLGFFYKHFDSADWAIAADAYQEFGNADYKDVRVAAVKMDADHIMKMLKDPSTSIARYGLLGLLLGHNGKAESHGKALKEFIDDPKVRQATGLDGLLAGLVLLDPKTGLEYVRGLINRTSEEFLVRYAALRTMRFFWDYRSDVVKKTDIVSGITPLLDQADIVDLAVEDLRKWEQWQVAPKLIELFAKPSHEASIIQRSIIKYALAASPSDKACQEFVTRLQKDEKQAERIKDLKELLDLEKPKPAKKDG